MCTTSAGEPDAATRRSWRPHTVHVAGDTRTESEEGITPTLWPSLVTPHESVLTACRPFIKLLLYCASFRLQQCKQTTRWRNNAVLKIVAKLYPFKVSTRVDLCTEQRRQSVLEAIARWERVREELLLFRQVCCMLQLLLKLSHALCHGLLRHSLLQAMAAARSSTTTKTTGGVNPPNMSGERDTLQQFFHNLLQQKPGTQIGTIFNNVPTCNQCYTAAKKPSTNEQRAPPPPQPVAINGTNGANGEMNAPDGQ